MTTDVQLIRVDSSPTGTQGALSFQEKPLCLTEELPWDDNIPEQSCIPEGVYSCVRHQSPDHPNTWQVMNVPNRSDVLIHTGNTIADTKGCILVGEQFTSTGVAMSVIALNYLNEVLGDNFTLTIKNAF